MTYPDKTNRSHHHQSLEKHHFTGLKQAAHHKITTVGFYLANDTLSKLLLILIMEYLMVTFVAGL
jgi:hypothetical protein